MKGNLELLTALNSLLADELTVLNQYIVHSEMLKNWGYRKLHLAMRTQVLDEMRHAEWLIERIIFFDGTPGVSKMNPIKIGRTVEEIISNHNHNELDAVHAYNNTIKLSQEAQDRGTVALLSKIVKMEERHVDWAEMQLAQVEQMGLENYLGNQN